MSKALSKAKIPSNILNKLFVQAKKIGKHVLSPTGMLLTLIAGLMINIMSNHIQYTIERQTYLELLQYEITSIALKATRELEAYGDPDNINSVIIFDGYPTDVYKAGLNNGYILSLDPATLGRITSFYEIKVALVNDLLFRDEALRVEHQNNWEKCLFDAEIGSKENCETEKQYLDLANSIYSGNRVLVAEDIGEDAFNVWKHLHLQAID